MIRVLPVLVMGVILLYAALEHDLGPRYTLLRTVWHVDGPPDVYVEDSGLTGEDCLAGLRPTGAAEWSCVLE